jgi:hypothetical protein
MSHRRKDMRRRIPGGGDTDLATTYQTTLIKRKCILKKKKFIMKYVSAALTSSLYIYYVKCSNSPLNSFVDNYILHSMLV